MVVGDNVVVGLSTKHWAFSGQSHNFLTWSQWVPGGQLNTTNLPWSHLKNLVQSPITPE